MEVLPNTVATAESVALNELPPPEKRNGLETDQASTKPASNFALPPRKRLKTSSTSLVVQTGNSLGNTSCPSSPTSPPSSPSFPVPPLSPTTLLQPSPINAGEKPEEEKDDSSSNGRVPKRKNGQQNKPIGSNKPQTSRKRKNAKFEASVFDPLPPRQAKVDSYKKANKQETREPKSKGKPQKKRKTKHDSSDSEETALYCLCKQPYDADQFMIACDACDDWFHVKCVNLTERKAKTLATYTCPLCKEKQREAEELKRKKQEERDKERKRELKKRKREKEEQETEEKEEEERDKVSRMCANDNCKAFAKPTSKYCSTKCGIHVAKQKLSEKQKVNQIDVLEPKPVQTEEQEKVTIEKIEASEEGEDLFNKSKALSVSESEDLKSLKVLESQKADTEQNLTLLKEKRLKLLEAIRFSTTLVAPTDVPKAKKDSSNGGTMDIMDCFSCGQPIPGKNFARHMEQCYAKKEGNVYSSAQKNEDHVAADGTTLTYCNYYDSRSGSYCTRLADSCPFHVEREKRKKTKRNQLCGCPTTDFESGYCERLRRECAKHVNWESIRTEELDQELKRLTKLLSSVQEEIEIVKSRIRRRNMSTDKQHRTIEEN